MFQPNKPRRLRANATQTYINCQRRHQRCETPKGDITCTYCRNNSVDYEKITPSKKRGRKSRSPGTTEAPYSFETVVSFIGQEQMPYDQNTALINSYEPSQNNDSLIITPYQNITLFSTSYLNETSSVKTLPNIYPCKAARTSLNMFLFVHEGPAQDNGLLIINPYQNIVLFFTSHFNNSSSVEISLNIHLCGAIKASQNAPAQNNDPLIINPYLNIIPFFNSYPNNFSYLETPDTYNNIIISSNIYAYGTNKLLPCSPFVYEGPAQNNNPLIINPYTPLFISYSNNFFSLETPDPYNNTITSLNIYAYGTNEQ
ncbi:17088_t:CDS:1 [Dentiscutata erythropus]|uniref:17088_t:CDS:1 n=1 Tax=Dentiscutata erythropus TaxID=1348616 RepID=A0A9N8YUP9_9GLOM|nr:17088_t:CDS:1 [Dentiscutata erythropus]